MYTNRPANWQTVETSECLVDVFNSLVLHSVQLHAGACPQSSLCSMHLLAVQVPSALCCTKLLDQLPELSYSEHDVPYDHPSIVTGDSEDTGAIAD